MKVNPDAATDMLPEGKYHAVVKRATDEVSKSGTDMIKLVLSAYDGQKVCDVFDYLLESDSWAWKVRHFCESAGLEWPRTSLGPEDCEGQNVVVWLQIEKQEGYADKNKVKDYLPRPTDVVVTAKPPVDDDIPFSSESRP